MSDTTVSEEFLDTYEGEVLFLSQDLQEIVQEMKDEAFNQESLEVLIQKLRDVSDVFLSSTYTQHVSPIFINFADYLARITCKDFMLYEDVSSYLCEIIEDVDTYITLYFVERTFSDVYLFQDSLQNSIEFLQRAYSCDIGECQEEDGSELDFF